MARPGLPGFLLALALGPFGAPGDGGAAAADDNVPLTLGQALQAAQQGNPELRAARERAGAAEARGEAASRARWPRASAAAEWGNSDNPARAFMWKLNRGGLDSSDLSVGRLNHPEHVAHLTTSIGVEAPLDVFGALRAEGRGADARGRAAVADADEVSEEIRLRVVETYRRLALAGAAIDVTNRAVDGARAREADIEARVSEGAALQADLLRARARRRQREADRAERQGELRLWRAALARLLGSPVAAYEAAEAATPPLPLDGDGRAWTERALERRGLIRAARERASSADWAERAERRLLLPDLGVYGQLQDDRGPLSSGQASASVGLVLRWSVFDPARGRRRAAAEAEHRASAADAQAAEDQVRLEVETTWRRAETARARYAAAAGGAAEGREALRVIQERRRAGMATLTDELETEAASLGAELEEMRAAAEAAVADAALSRAAGEL